MNDLVHIQNTDISVKEYRGQRVVTLKDVDMVHDHEQTAECSDGGTASVITLHFGNDFHVAAVVDFIDGEPHIIELYAVDDNGKKI